jgi:succinate dehydrogenase / fumarate reductase iron-sulfur subunit
MIEVRPPAEVSATTASAREPAADGQSGTVAHLRVFRGEPGARTHFDEFEVPVEEGMVVLDALHWIQGNAAPDLAVRWNCKAAKCGSCSAEVNGRPRLTCKTRLTDFDLDEEITVEPMRSFPLIRDLVTDVSWNYRVNESIEPFSPPPGVPQSEWRWQQEDIERVQEFRKCIECFLCQDVCHVLRNHETERPFMGPRFLVRAAGLEMHPIDQADRRRYLKDTGGVGYCNITKCCTEVCPEHIKITDNAIIPLKERVADEFYDPIQWVWRKLRGDTAAPTDRKDLPVLPARPAPAREPSVEASPDRLARAVGEDSSAAEPMGAPEPATPPAPKRASTRPKRPRRRSDATDETPSEG